MAAVGKERDHIVVYIYPPVSFDPAPSCNRDAEL